MYREVKDGKLFFDGVDMTELSKKYGTPLYVYSENDIISRFEDLKKNFVEKYERVRVAYAAKAFFPLAMAKLVDECGMCVDVVSGGELYTAIKAGFPAEKIEFNGNNKSIKELEMAVDYEIGRIIVDSLQELASIEKICKEKGKVAKILFRVTPGVKSDSHDYIVTGKKDSKFGIPLDDEVIMPQIKAAIDSEYIDFYGIHFHVGSQLFDNGSHLQATDIILALVEKIKNNFGYDVKELNVGGGFGVTYVDEHRQPYTYFLDPIMEKIENYYTEKGVKRPNVVIEPGRSIIAEAGLTLYTIGSIKQIPGIRKYVSVDGGMTDNIRPALYEAVYTGVITNKADQPKTETVRICGKCCESGDILIRDIDIAEPEAGDTFAIFSTGAYGYTMASNYNKNTIPGVVFVKDGQDRVVVKAQTYDDMIANEIL
ncbi:MAG: diaminopimelate decarboxylase [Firmicutes bacterium]|nr:diaminopimelate decarboxylase [Bacillota bacterium]